jgi:uncharacterized phage infection (PIP) family protein YhgE
MNFLRVSLLSLFVSTTGILVAEELKKEIMSVKTRPETKVHISKEEDAELKADLEKYKGQLKKQVLSHDQATDLIKSIEMLDKKMKSLEDGAGITPLYDQLDQLRHDICLMQRSNKDAVNILNQIKEQRKIIKSKTKREQSLIKTLTKKLQRTNDDIDDYEAKRISKRIEQLQREIAQKSFTEKNRMKSLNKKLAQIPAFKDKLQKAKKIDREIYNKAQRIKSEMLQLKKQRDAAYERLNVLIADDESVIKLKKWIAKTRLQLHAKAPCTLMEKRYPDWIDNII